MDQQIIYDEELPEMHEHMLLPKLPVTASASNASVRPQHTDDFKLFLVSNGIQESEIKIFQDDFTLPSAKPVIKIAAPTSLNSTRPQASKMPSSNLQTTGDAEMSQNSSVIGNFAVQTVAPMLPPTTSTKKRQPKNSTDAAKKMKKSSPSMPMEANETASDGEDKSQKGEVKGRFTSSMDLKLLREIAVSKPFIGSFRDVATNWKKTYENLRWNKFSVLAIQRRFDLLKKKFISQENASLKSSGTDEDYDEKMSLLTDIMESFKSRRMCLNN